MIGRALIAATLSCASFSAWAQDTDNPIHPIVTDLSAPWTHSQTGITLAPKIDGFDRTEIVQNGLREIDLWATYKDSNSNTTATAYVFRASLPVVPIWFDRIVDTMHSPESFQRLGGKLTPEPVTTAFTPPGDSKDSALRAVYAMDGGRFKSTGTAVIPHDQWLITMRISSATLDKNALDATLARFIESIRTGNHSQAPGPAKPVTACTDTLPVKPAKRAKPDPASSFMTGLLGSIARNGPGEADESTDRPPSTPGTDYCRYAASNAYYGVYRRADMNGSYVIALDDAGITIQVEPSLAALMDDRKPQFDIQLSTLEDDYSFVPFLSLPTPEQAIQTTNTDQPVSRSDRSGNITLFKP